MPWYGIDSPRIVAAHYVLGTAGLGAGAALRSAGRRPAHRAVGRAAQVLGVLTLAECTGIVLSGLVGKRLLWRGLLPRLDLTGSERVLDVGTGSGMQLAAVARRLSDGGVAVGLDRWSSHDQSANHSGRTLANMRAEGVRRRVRLVLADARSMPFPDGGFDVVISTLAVHNIPGAGERGRALREMVRVLRPGGRLTIVDFWHTASYPAVLRAAGCRDVRLSGLRFLPYPHVRVVTAVRGPAGSGPARDGRSGG